MNPSLNSYTIQMKEVHGQLVPVKVYPPGYATAYGKVRAKSRTDAANTKHGNRGKLVGYHLAESGKE